MGGAVDFITGRSGKRATRRADEAVRQYNDIEAPNIEFERLGADYLGDRAQKQALKQLGQISKTGYDDIDRARMAQLQQQEAMQAQANRAAALESLQRRGVQGGAQIASALQGTQAARNQAANQALAIAAEGANRRLQATGMLGNEAARRRAASEAINRFNIENRQNVANMNFGNRMDLAGGKANALMGAANQYQARQNRATNAVFQAVGMARDAAEGAGQTMARSDERTKKAVTPADKELAEMFDKVDAVSFEYKGEPGKRVAGVMAQDLERSKLGRDMVTEVEGVKHIKIPQAVSALMAAQKIIMDKLGKLESEESDDEEESA